MNVYFEIVISCCCCCCCFFFHFIQSVVSVSACNFYCVNKLETWTRKLFLTLKTHKHFYFYQPSSRQNMRSTPVWRIAYDEKEMKKKMQFAKPSKLQAQCSMLCMRAYWAFGGIVRLKNRKPQKGTCLTWPRKKWCVQQKSASYSMNEWNRRGTIHFSVKRIRAWNIFSTIQSTLHRHERAKSLLSFELALISRRHCCCCQHRRCRHLFQHKTPSALI